jgi:hypothetical protein
MRARKADFSAGPERFMLAKERRALAEPDEP